MFEKNDPDKVYPAEDDAADKADDKSDDVHQVGFFDNGAYSDDNFGYPVNDRYQKKQNLHEAG